MNAVVSKLIGDLGRRRLQSVVILMVVLLSSAAATLALSLAVETNAPYDQAFARADGPHLVLTIDAGKVQSAHLRQAARTSDVTAVGGPWPEIETVMSPGAARNGAGSKGPASSQGFLPQTNVLIVGRKTVPAAVDRLTVVSGGWLHGANEVVLSRPVADQFTLFPGSRIQLPGLNAHRSFLVVGIAASINPAATVWMVPQEVRRLAGPAAPLHYQLELRVRDASSEAGVRAATQAVAAGLPPGAITATSDWITFKRDAEILTAVMVPFLLSFSVFGLVAAALIVANIVGGVVTGSYRDIGIMKSVGFTPLQVMTEVLAQVMVPAAIGCALGVVAGTVASQPFLDSTAHALGLPSPSTQVGDVALGVGGLVLLITLLAGLLPAWRAGKHSAITAITKGTAPSHGHSKVVARILADIPAPRALTLGLEQSLARPTRSLLTVGSIVVGVSTIVFALGLQLSLGQVASHLDRSSFAQLQFGFPAGSDGTKLKHGPSLPPQPSHARITQVFRSNADVERFVGESQAAVTAAGIAEPIQFYAYDGPSSWLGYALIAGRWFNRLDEVVAPTRMLTQAHLSVGDAALIHNGPHSVQVRIVGEILDQTDNDLLLRGSWATLHQLDPTTSITDYELHTRSGIDPLRVAEDLSNTLAPNGPNAFNIDVRGTGTDTSFILLNGVIGGLAIILVAIALAGVFNTVMLATRERAKEIGILKAIGMAPAQVILMVVTSVTALGLVAGPLGIPTGLELQRRVLQLMGQAASATRIPPAFFSLIGAPELALLAFTGIALAVIGAILPARWAASRRTAKVLLAE